MIKNINKNHLLLKTMSITNILCPLCYTFGKMNMSFYQVQLEAGWERNTKQITASAYCNSCEKTVPTVGWSEELEAFYKIEKNNIAVSTSFKMGKVGKFLVVLNIVFFSAVILFLLGIFIYYRVRTKQQPDVKKEQLEYRTYK